MKKIIALIALVTLTGCTTTKEVATAPVRVVEYVNENGQRIIVHYYDDLKELNQNNETDKVILFKREF